MAVSLHSVFVYAMKEQVNLSGNFMTVNAMTRCSTICLYVCVCVSTASPHLGPHHHPVLGPSSIIGKPSTRLLGPTAPPRATTSWFQTSLELGNSLDMLPNPRHTDGSSIASQIKDAQDTLDTDSFTKVYIGREAQPEGNSIDSSS